MYPMCLQVWFFLPPCVRTRMIIRFWSLKKMRVTSLSSVRDQREQKKEWEKKSSIEFLAEIFSPETILSLKLLCKKMIIHLLTSPEQNFSSFSYATDSHLFCFNLSPLFLFICLTQNVGDGFVTADKAVLTRKLHKKLPIESLNSRRLLCRFILLCPALSSSPKTGVQIVQSAYFSKSWHSLQQ
jgi:hypothetical protein